MRNFMECTFLCYHSYSILPNDIDILFILTKHSDSNGKQEIKPTLLLK